VIEECAKVADACFADIKGNPHDFGPIDSGGLRAAEKIAAAIRSLSPTDKGASRFIEDAPWSHAVAALKPEVGNDK